MTWTENTVTWNSVNGSSAELAQNSATADRYRPSPLMFFRSGATVRGASKQATAAEKIYVQTTRQTRLGWLTLSGLTAEIAKDADDLTER
ncbi:hypothetical protein GCM10022629_62370 [Amorphoplanes auranticolor]